VGTGPAASIRAMRGDEPKRRKRVARAEVVQAMLDLFDDPVYLEVGVSRGTTFHALRAARKTAVDPRFRFDTEDAAREDPTATYHEVTSDVFFGERVDPAERFEVIYLDGMHTLEQTLRDFTNALGHLAPGGVVVIDDVRPASYLAAIADIEEHRRLKQAVKASAGAWMGDVYRLVFFLETFFQQITYRTVAENHGQLVAWRQRRPAVPERGVEEVARLPYERAVLDEHVFHRMPLAEIVAGLRDRPRT
jgi:methyltransferase family protein